MHVDPLYGRIAATADPQPGEGRVWVCAGPHLAPDEHDDSDRPRFDLPPLDRFHPPSYCPRPVTTLLEMPAVSSTGLMWAVAALCDSHVELFDERQHRAGRIWSSVPLLHGVRLTEFPRWWTVARRFSWPDLLELPAHHADPGPPPHLRQHT